MATTIIPAAISIVALRLSERSAARFEGSPAFSRAVSDQRFTAASATIAANKASFASRRRP